MAAQSLEWFLTIFSGEFVTLLSVTEERMTASMMMMNGSLKPGITCLLYPDTAK